MIEEATNSIAEDNIELAQCYIIKFAVERAVPELERRLAAEFEMRRRAKSDGRRYQDPTVSQIVDRLPSPLKIQAGELAPQHTQVYEEFAKNIPGFRPATEQDLVETLVPGLSKLGVSAAMQSAAAPPPVTPSGDDAEQLYRQVLMQVEKTIASLPPTVQGLPQVCFFLLP